jgi:hypothetical protein
MLVEPSAGVYNQQNQPAKYYHHRRSKQYIENVHPEWSLICPRYPFYRHLFPGDRLRGQICLLHPLLIQPPVPARSQIVQYIPRYTGCLIKERCQFHSLNLYLGGLSYDGTLKIIIVQFPLGNPRLHSSSCHAVGHSQVHCFYIANLCPNLADCCRQLAQRTRDITVFASQGSDNPVTAIIHLFTLY